MPGFINIAAMDFNLPLKSILLMTLSIVMTYNGNSIVSGDFFDVYAGLQIEKGLLLEKLETGLVDRDDAMISCLIKCKENADCSMVTLEKFISFNCSFWKFNQTHDITPSPNVNSTLYTKKNCEYMMFLLSSEFDNIFRAASFSLFHLACKL